MADRVLRYVLTGEDRSASKTITGTAQSAERASTRIGGAFSKAGQIIGGEFGELLTKAGEGLDNLGEKGKGLASKMEIGGAGIAALGGAMTLLGSKRQAAEGQLRAAIDATGKSYDDYEGQINKAVKANEKFGHGENDTMAALQALTAATNDPAKALANMGLVANLAAAKHESLAEAAGQVAKVYGGSGKVLKAYGITLESSAKDTAAFTAAQKAHQTAVTNLAAAQRKLTDLEAVDASKVKMSVSDQITLRKAHEAVTIAVRDHGAKSKEAQKAEQALADTEARLTDKSKLSTAQQLALKNAQEAVAVAQAKVAATLATLNTATDNNKTATQTADTALGQLSQKLSGQASAASDTWAGKLKGLSSELADGAAKLSQKYGPAVTMVGGAISAAGKVLGFFRDRHAAAALATAADTRATQAETAAIRGEGAAAASTASELTGLAAARGRAGGAALAGGAARAEGAAAGAGIAGGAGAVGGEAAAAGEAGAAGLSAIVLPAAIAVAAIAGVGTAFEHLTGGASKWAHTTGVLAALSKTTGAAKDLTGALAEDNGKLGQNTEAMIMTQAQSNGLGDSFGKAHLSLADLTRGVTGSNDEFGQMLNTWRASAHPSAEMIAKLDAMRMSYLKATVATSDAANKQAQLNSELNAMKPPEPLHLKVIDNASHTIGVVESELLGLDGRVVNSIVEVSVQGKGADYGVSGGNHGATSYRRDAEGTDYASGGSTLVGERGPEVVTLPRGSTVTPYSASGSRAGGTVVFAPVIHVHSMTGTIDVASQKQLVGALEEWVGSGRGIRGITS